MLVALKNCKECGKEISTKAEACPHCGAKKPKPYKPSGCLTVIVLAAIVLVASNIMESLNPRPVNVASTKPVFTESSAIGACRNFIEQSLHDPDSAEFSPSNEAGVEKHTGGVWVVLRSVRAKNAFNATRMAVFECRMQESGDSWIPLSVKQIP